MDTVMIEMRRAERNFWAILAAIALSLLFAASAGAQTPCEWKTLKGDINLFVANDLGRNGYYDQKPIAELMGKMADEIGPEAVVAIGDIHHFDGVASVNDPLWMTNYELIYSHPELMISWLPVLGNHEYRGNTQAVLDYSKVSRRWQIENRYYSKTFADDKTGATLRIVFLDTTPLIDGYRQSKRYPDAGKQVVDEQLQWLDTTLKEAKEDWIVVVGHHPIYAETKRDVVEQKDMQRRLLPILHKYNNVSMYVCGHIHNFQHIRKNGDTIDYVVNSAGSLSRKVKPTDGTVFCSPSTGFSVISATKESLSLYMIDNHGVAIHQVKSD